jgi:hypothetical protein
MEEKSQWVENEAKAFNEEFGSILAKDVASLTEYDKQFLVGRRDMLNKEQQDKFGAVIDATLKANLASAPAPKAAKTSVEE